MLRRSLVLAALAAAAFAVAPATASASELIDRNAQNVRLAVNPKGQALLTYRARGRTWRVLAWGAINALPPTRGRRQVARLRSGRAVGRLVAHAQVGRLVHFVRHLGQV